MNIIYSTIYMDVSMRSRLISTSRAAGLSLTSSIIALLGKFTMHHAENGRAWIRIRYQPRKKDRNGTRIHVRLSPAEYEFILDLRRVHKRSVSSLVALAADMYLDEMMDTTISTGDKNHIQSYSFSKLIIDGVTCWMHTWGIPCNSPLFQLLIHNTA